MSLFEPLEREHRERVQPLAARMRPRTLAEFVGQCHFLGPDKLLRRLIAARRLGSLIFYGPPGTGKTTLARLVAQETEADFLALQAVASGVKEIRQVLDQAREKLETAGTTTVLLVDEIHRLSRAQQDVLLHDVEDGLISLIGATTSNPYFAVSRALVSRSQIFEFQPLEVPQVVELLQRALRDPRGLAEYRAQVEPEALRWLAEMSDGDARRALQALEIAVLSNPSPPVKLDKGLLAESLQKKSMDYDRDGDAHYDLASALIKSIRGSDPDAGIYWLARMLEGGEDIRFLCRRLVILASEDIGNADPQALPLAVAAMQACEFVGLPECQLTLAQAVAYLACAPKSNAATRAISAARQDVRQGYIPPVPEFLRDSHYAGAKALGHGQGYQYAHDAEGAIVPQAYMPEDRQYYQPTDRGYEAHLQQVLQKIRRRLGRPS
jgi:putative ATPase